MADIPSHNAPRPVSPLPAPSVPVSPIVFPHDPAGVPGLRGKVAFITGAASGLGAALAAVLTEAGADVTLPIDALSEQDWLRVVGTNLNGPFMLAKHAAARARAAAGGNGSGTGGDIVLPVHETSWP